jgi:serine/threonine protein kinase
MRHRDLSHSLATRAADRRARREVSAFGTGSLANSVAGQAPADVAAPVGLPARYELLEEIGRGGMGVVYRAFDRERGGEVAIKRMLPERLGDEAAHTRFRREAEAVAALHHPNIVRVLEVGEDARGLYVVMALHGESLADRIRVTGRLGLTRTLTIARQVGDALATAHGRGIVHRDVKPSNILLAPGDVPKLCDFGLARIAGASELTVAGAVLGSPWYMAPEQRRDPSGVDARADVFALAATIYACLTGTTPRVIRESQVPARIRFAVLKGLEEDPRQRWGSMRQMLMALGRPGPTSWSVGSQKALPARRWNPELSPGRAFSVVMLFVMLLLGAYAGVGGDRAVGGSGAPYFPSPVITENDTPDDIMRRHLELIEREKALAEAAKQVTRERLERRGGSR